MKPASSVGVTPPGPAVMSWSPFVALFLLGLGLRLLGLLFNGMYDLDQILLDWGAAVSRDGLGRAFAINYGVLSYAAFGFAAWMADLVPRFWWAPYKLIILACDLGVLAALLGLAGRENRMRVLMFFWINPWFILHEAFQGFWEAPHILFGLLAVLAMRRMKSSAQPMLVWVVTGALLMGSAMVKPQGLLYFVGPVGLSLVVWASVPGLPAFVGFLVGLVAAVAAASALVWSTGGSALAVVLNYRSAFTVMPGVSNGGPGIWRFVVFVYMWITGQSGHVSAARMPNLLVGVLSLVAALVSLVLLLWFAEQIRRRLPKPEGLLSVTPDVLLLVLILGSLVVSQFGVRAHINHSFTALVLLVPLVVTRPSLRRLWLPMVSLLGLSHWLLFGLGRPALLPASDALYQYPAAGPLIDQVTALSAYRTPDALLNAQFWVNEHLTTASGETVVSILSPVIFVLACLIARALFQEAKLVEVG